MLIKIDTREAALFQQIQTQISFIPVFKSIEIRSETLPIGDIIISDGKEDILIVERKSVADLLSSIKDGRYEEQSYRLNGLAHHNHNIIYLIEGDVNKLNRFKSDSSVEKLTLYSAMFSLNYYKGFSVFRSFSMEETANVLCNMAYKLAKEASTKVPYYKFTDSKEKESPDEEGHNGEGHKEEGPNGEGHKEEGTKGEGHKEEGDCEPTEKDYVSVIKKVKKENITPDNIGEIMLCQIPGISSVTALAVMEKYGTIPNLLKELEANNDSMKDLSYTNAKGQVRKINKTSIANIVKFLLKK
jgi:ERCC4-type nuclease